ncbi:hypothetical protein OLMES_4038 [Oleiphilus messinensis]|uniref:EamA domain-containing protein n=1 Tax=Oleiphilus messinensis TaxID=141451 RepID=A0A1Y0IE42_9GAMM|nr:DMT family transporter [Oleiphilus messinensis]ARU58056.1 hypothetical protein OLMES_4038 [Oleiphilus messinensis]
MKSNSLAVAVGLLMAATLSWGGMFAVAKPALGVMDPFYLTLIRYGVAAVLFVLILIWVEGAGALRLEGRLGLLFLLATLGFAGFNLLAFNGLVHTRPEHGAVIMAMMPMITAILTWLFKGVRPKRFTLAAIIVAFLGVFLVITRGDPMQASAGGSGQWGLVFLAGAFCWVSYTMGAQSFPNWSPLRYTAVTCVLGTISITLITFGFTMSGMIHTPDWETVVSLKGTFLYLIVLGALVAVLSWNTGIKIMGPVNGVLFINFVPITAFTIGVIQGRSFTTAELVGASFVIGALVANNLYLRKLERAAKMSDRTELVNSVARLKPTT